MQFRASLHLFLCLILMIPGLSYAEMYKWIDDQGRVHYGDKPKGKTTAIQVKPVQKHQSTPFKSTKTTKSKSKKATKTTGLTNEQWFQAKSEKVKSMSAEDIRQHNAEFLRKEEQIKQGILLQMEEDEARWEEQAKERQRKFDDLNKERSRIRDNNYGVKEPDSERLKKIHEENKKARAAAKRRIRKEKRSLRRNPIGGGSMRYN